MLSNVEANQPGITPIKAWQVLPSAYHALGATVLWGNSPFTSTMLIYLDFKVNLAFVSKKLFKIKYISMDLLLPFFLLPLSYTAHVVLFCLSTTQFLLSLPQVPSSLSPHLPLSSIHLPSAYTHKLIYRYLFSRIIVQIH